MVSDADPTDLDLGFVDAADHPEDQPRDRDRSSRRRRNAGLAAVAVLVGALVVVLVSAPSTTPDRSAEPAPTAGRSVDGLGPVTVGELREGDGPLLDEPLEEIIAIGGNDRELVVVDLATGDVISLGLEAEPQLIESDFLLTRDDWNRWEVIDLDDPDIDRRTPTADGALFASAVEAEAGGVWFRHPGMQGRQSWSRADIASGVVVEAVTVPGEAGVLADSVGRPLSGPELVSADSGGVYALGPDNSYELVLDARLIAFDDTLVFGSTCDEDLVCANRWFDRSSFAPLDLPVPDVEFGGGYIRGGAVLVAETYTGTDLVVKLFDIATGQAIATGDSRDLARIWVSPSGRYVARPGFGALLISDTQGANSVVVDRLTIDVDVQLVWG